MKPKIEEFKDEYKQVYWIVNDRYQIYADGVVYDNDASSLKTCEIDFHKGCNGCIHIPQYIFKIKDRLLGVIK